MKQRQIFCRLTIQTDIPQYCIFQHDSSLESTVFGSAKEQSSYSCNNTDRFPAGEGK